MNGHCILFESILLVSEWRDGGKPLNSEKLVTWPRYKLANCPLLALTLACSFCLNPFIPKFIGPLYALKWCPIFLDTFCVTLKVESPDIC